MTCQCTTCVGNKRLRDSAGELLKSLQSTLRIAEALSYHTQLGRSQRERLDKSKALIARLTSTEHASKVCVGAGADGEGRQVPPSAGGNPSPATEGAAPISTSTERSGS